MAEANCMNCGDSFDPEHSHMDYVCDFCISTNEDHPTLQEYIDCGVEHYSSDNKSACTDCLNNPYL